MMSPLREIQKKYCSRAMFAAIGMGGLFFLLGFTDLMKGLILGTLFSSINFVLIGETLPQRINKGKAKIFLAALGSMAFRYLLLAVPVVLALKYEKYNLITAIIGVFMVQIMILLDQVGRKFTRAEKM